MTKVFLSPSDQDNNPVAGGGTEQQYAQARCARAAEVLRSYDGYEVRVSSAGIGDDNAGFLASIAEGNAWGADLYVADHSNAGNGKASGVQAYCYTPDPESVRLGQCINARMDPIVPGGASIQDGQHLGEVNSSTATAVLMESGYHDNPTDAAVIRTKTREMGEALAYGILDYYGTTVNMAAASNPEPITKYQEDDMEYIISEADRGQSLIRGGVCVGIPTPEFSGVLQGKVPGIKVVECNKREYDVLRAMHQPAVVDLSPVLTAIKSAARDQGISDEAIAKITDAVARVDAAAVAGQLEVGVKA